jgi:hypothetical protein
MHVLQLVSKRWPCACAALCRKLTNCLRCCCTTVGLGSILTRADAHAHAHTHARTSLCDALQERRNETFFLFERGFQEYLRGISDFLGYRDLCHVVCRCDMWPAFGQPLANMHAVNMSGALA